MPCMSVSEESEEQEGNTAIMLIYDEDEKDLAELRLLATKTDVNAANKQGVTALMIVA